MSEMPYTVVLAGNPNVGKSTVFNALTGLNQHTGNWTGKTVGAATGAYQYKGEDYCLVDLPGTYSLEGCSSEEQAAGAYLSTRRADCVVAVCDSACLERNLYLVLQLLSQAPRVIVCVNLLDEAARKGILVDLSKLSVLLGVPVVGTAAGRRRGLEELQAEIAEAVQRRRPPKLLQMEEAQMMQYAEEIAAQVVQFPVEDCNRMDRRLDRIFMGRLTGIPIMLLLLFVVFYLTIWGANGPSALLQRFFDWLGEWLNAALKAVPDVLRHFWIDGIYCTAARVTAVMLPPMAIFFPLFTLLEDFGYLPRAAFVLDSAFRRCGACGKQALTLCMGFGCNAVGVTGCRIIDSPRERAIAVLTNALVPCNGRFPLLITLISVFFAGEGRLRPVRAAAMLTGFVVLSILMTFFASWLLSRTVLRGAPSSFALELPPYRRPQIGQVLIRSVLDRTMFVLGRAVAVAAPAGAVIWCIANLKIGGISILQHCTQNLDPIGVIFGVNGAILMAFVLGFPANELVLPIILMAMTAGTVVSGETAMQETAQTLISGGWTSTTALCTMLLCLFHWPCSTTCLTIHKETGSWRMVGAAILLPTSIGLALCSAVHAVAALF